MCVCMCARVHMHLCVCVHVCVCLQCDCLSVLSLDGCEACCANAALSHLASLWSLPLSHGPARAPRVVEVAFRNLWSQPGCEDTES